MISKIQKITQRKNGSLGTKGNIRHKKKASYSNTEGTSWAQNHVLIYDKKIFTDSIMSKVTSRFA